MKTKMLMIRISEAQDEELIKRALSAGYNKKSEYVRMTLFGSLSQEEKLNKIYQKVMELE